MHRRRRSAYLPSLVLGLLPVSATAQTLNEVVADHAGADTEELVEIFGDPDTAFTDYWVLAVDGTGLTDAAIQAGTTDAQGFWVSSLGAEALSDDTLTFLLVEAWSGTLGEDLDTDDDGTLDVLPWTALVDDLAFGRGAGLIYSTSDVGDVGGASRIPNGQDQDQAADWQANDFDGAGLDGFGGVPGQGEAWNTPGAVNRTNAVDYYAGVVFQDAATLRTLLHEVIDDHVRFPYSSAATDTWDILEQADEDPTDAANVLTVYKNSSEVKFGGGTGPYNREHTWPSSLGFPDQQDGLGPSYPYTDCHHLRLANPAYNGDRGSRAFGTCSAACSERPTDVNNGRGGGSGVYPGNSDWVTGPDRGAGTWEVWGARKGDVARSILYMDLRYEGGNHGATGFPEPDLELTDDTGLIQSSGSNTTGTAYMGRRSAVLAWHAADPPDADEMLRNEVVYRYQGNRNPFVDHPQWVGCVYQGIGCDTPFFRDGFESGDLDGWSAVSP
jgi:endonuclease I